MASPHQRPDLAAMAGTLPSPAGPSSVDMQAAAILGNQKPYVEFGGGRWYIARPVDLFDLAELGEAIDRAEANPLSTIGTINRCLREWMADYPGLRARFRTVHTDAGEAAMEAWAGLAQGVFAAVAARPTGQPGDSSAGPGSTSTSSKDGSPSAEQAWYPPPTHE